MAEHHRNLLAAIEAGVNRVSLTAQVRTPIAIFSEDLARAAGASEELIAAAKLSPQPVPLAWRPKCKQPLFMIERPVPSYEAAK